MKTEKHAREEIKPTESFKSESYEEATKVRTAPDKTESNGDKAKTLLTDCKVILVSELQVSSRSALKEVGTKIDEAIGLL